MRLQQAIAAAVVLLAALTAGCAQVPPADQNSNSGKVEVAVSILPQADFVRRVGGDKVHVTVMIPPGASPENYEPTPNQLKGLSRADLYIGVGQVPFETIWMDRIRSANKEMGVVDSSTGIQTVAGDPHTWLSPELVKIQAQNICQALTETDPADAEYFRANLAAFSSDLDALDADITDTLAGMKNREFLVYHPAWEYFARQYGLTQISIEVEGKEPGAGHMAQVVDHARANGMTVIFASPQTSTKSAKVVADEIGGKVVLIDPLAEDYMANMRLVAQTFARELKQ